jgi:hypothetical protein
MADSTDAVVEQTNHLGMSDADFLNAPPPEATVVETPVVEEEAPAEAEPVAQVEEKPAEVDTDDEDGDKPSEEAVNTEAKEPKAEVKVEESTDKAEKPKVDETPINFEAEYKRILAPFKANGREVQVNSVDDAIQLMQMGANYNKRMAALKPNLKIMRMLENNGLLDEGKLSYLIDLDKKNPDAISKLVKESGIDPMSIDIEKADAYKQTPYTVDDRELELDTVLGEIKESPTYNRTLDIVGTKWDDASKQTIAKQPQLLKIINQHVELGIYDIISKRVESERMFGRLAGLTEIDAYKQVGDTIREEGGFNHLAKGSSQAQVQTPVTPIVVPPKVSKEDEDKLKEKKRAASSTKPSVAAKTDPAYNVLAMSDAEFIKMSSNKFK